MHKDMLNRLKALKVNLRFSRFIRAHKKTSYLRNDERGFTLIEIMVVLFILGLLAALVAPNFIGQSDEARVKKTKLDIASLETTLDMYKLDNGVYPTTEQGLYALIEEPRTEPIPKKWRKGGYLKKAKIPLDAWGNEFVYISPGMQGDYEIISYGMDGVPGGEDYNADINSWNLE